MALKTQELADLVGHIINSETGVLDKDTVEARGALGAAAVRAVFGVIEQQLLEQQPVMIRGAGAFELTWTPARLGHSSIKRHKVVVPGRYRVLFRPAQALRNKLRDAEISQLGREREHEYEQQLLRGLIASQGFGGFSDTGA